MKFSQNNFSRVAKIAWLCSFLALASASLNAEETNVLTLQDAWVRAMPPGMKMTAAFGTLGNAGETAVELVSWDADVYGDVTLHRTELVDGVSKMKAVGDYSLAPNDALVLEPGSFHLMLMAPSAEAASAETITLGVTSSAGQRFEFEVPVKKR